ncbi:hypothetical protein PARMER_04271 [Parabacteroides merdae ATCC 43184]|nr:hypothetical protein PARMER_04271 [Parabacteroides merdae ATCC 43184]
MAERLYGRSVFFDYIFKMQPALCWADCDVCFDLSSMLPS